MSSIDEIRAVYDEDIEKKTNIVWNKCGKSPFYENFKDFSIETLGEGLGIERIVCSEFFPKSKKRGRCL